MQRQMVMLTILILCAVMLSGCVSSHGRMNQGFSSQTVLEQGNHKIIHTVQGTATGTYVMGIPIDGETDLWAAAMNVVRDEANLSNSQAFANMAHDETSKGVGIFYYVKKLTITTDVVEFTK